MIKVNLRETFEPEFVSEDFEWMIFYAPLREGGKVLLKVAIEPLGNSLLPDAYNLAFGPVDGSGEIDDLARIFHSNPHKVFSTILLFCLNFLLRNTNLRIGLDGSSDTRAYLYHRMFITNKEYLDEYFETFGVDLYVRMFRNGDLERNVNGKLLSQPKPENFNYKRSLKDLYRYYMFQLNHKK